MLGIHGDPVKARRRIDLADRKGERLGADAYGYKRAFSYSPSKADREWFGSTGSQNVTVLDPTAGGGSIPFESVRLGLKTIANDLNPVASLILKATVELPLSSDLKMSPEFSQLGNEFTRRVRETLEGVFPDEGSDRQPDGYIYARTIECPILQRSGAAVTELDVSPAEGLAFAFCLTKETGRRLGRLRFEIVQQGHPRFQKAPHLAVTRFVRSRIVSG